MPFEVTDNDTGLTAVFDNEPTDADLSEAFGPAPLPDESVKQRLDRERAEGIVPVIGPLQKQSFFERSGINDLIREDPEKLKAKAQNSIAFAEMFNIPPSEAYDLHDELSEEVGLRQEITTEEFIGGATLPVIAAGLATNPVGALLGIGVFEAIGEGESAAINLFKGEKYQAFQKKGLSDLLPEDASQLTTDVVDTLDFLGKGLVAHGVFRNSPRLMESITKQIITEHKGPEKLFINPADLRAELQTGGVLPAEEAAIIGELTGLGKIQGESAMKVALRKGVSIEIPAERITVLRDRPWFAKVKKILKIDPAQDIRRVEGGGEKIFKFGEEEVTVKTPEAILQIEKLENDLFAKKLTEEEVIKQAKEIERTEGKTPRLEGEVKLPLEGEAKPLSEFPKIEEAPELIPVIEKLKLGDETAIAELRGIAEKRGARIFDVLGNNLVEITEAYKPLLPKVNALNAEFRAKAEGEIVTPEQRRLGEVAEEFARREVKGEVPTTPEALEAQTPLEVPEKDIESIVFGEQTFQPAVDFTETRKGVIGISKDIVAHMKHRIEAGEAGKQTSTTDPETGKTVPIVTKSTFPQWFQNKGLTKKQVLPILDKVASGKKLTDKQQDIFDGLLQGAQKEFFDAVSDQPVLLEVIKRNKLFPGDRLILDGTEAFIIEGVSDQGNIILRGEERTIELDPFEDTRGRVSAVEKGSLPEQLPQKEIDKFVKAIEKRLGVEKPKGTKLKTFIRKSTGLIKISDLVTEEAALKASFKKAQAAARQAFREGSKEGVAKENLRLKELATRSKFRKEASSEVRKMIKNLKNVQKNLDKFHPSFKEPINDLIEGIDLVRLGGKKKVRLQNLSNLIERDFVNVVELSDNTISQLKRLDKFNVGDMTFDELNEIHDAIMHLTHLNKLKNEILVNQKVRKFNEVLNQTVKEMKPPKEVAQGIVSSQPGAFKKARGIGNLIKDTFGIRHDAYDLIIESIAGLNSTIQSVLFDAIDAGTDAMILHKKNTYNKFQSDLEGFSERHGVDDIANWLDEPVIVGNFRLTRNERMELFNHSLNEDNRAAILEGGFGFRTSDTPDVIYSMTEAEMNQIIDSMTPAEKEFSGKPVRNLFADQRESLNEVFLKRNNYAMPDIVNYYPKDVMPIGRKIDDSFLEAETALDSLKGQFTRVGINKDHLRPRVGSAAPIYINGLTNTLNKSIVRSAAYIGLEIPMSNASKLLYNKQFRNEIITRYDRITWQEIEKGLRDIAGDYKSYSTVETLLLRAKNNVATAFLGLNPFVMAKQIISLPLYGTFVKGDFLIQGAMDYLNNATEIKARHSLYSPKWFERTEGGFSRDVADVFKSGGEKRLFKGKKTIQESTMKGIQLFDEAAVGPGMQGAVLQVISEFQKGKLSSEVRQAINIKDSDIKNLTPEEKMVLAYKFADFVTVRTQPMFSPAHRSSLQRGTPLEVLATMFGSFTNRALNLLRRTYRESKREQSPEANAKFARALFTVMVINSLAVTAIDSVRDKMRGREISIESVLTRIMTSWTGYFFFLRDISSAISSSLISGNRYSGFDVQLPVQRPVNMTKDVALEGIDLIQAIADNDERKAKEAALRFIDDGIGLALMTKGIPYETPKRFAQDLLGFNKKSKKVKRPKIQRR